MIEIVFSESFGGSIKMAKNYKNPADQTATSVGIIGKELTKDDYEKILAEVQKRDKGKPIGGNSNEVIILPFMLDIGDIKENICSNLRKNIILDMYSTVNSNIKSSNFDDTFKEYTNNLEKLKKLAESGEKFRIWYSDAPYSICGFYFVCDFLNYYNVEVSAIKLPFYAEKSFGNTHKINLWSEIPPAKLYKFLPFEKNLDATALEVISMIWNTLKDENSFLRVVINGVITSVSDNFYDEIIRKEISKFQSKFRIGQLIGNVLSKYNFGVGDFWYASRIKQMIKNGELTILDDKDSFFYSHVVKAEKI